MGDGQSVDFKFVESYLKDKFLKPFSRRLKYIYLGLDHDQDTFVLSDTEDTDFKYCEAMQTTGLLKINNVEHLQKILCWFDYMKIDRSSPCIFYLSKVVTILNKIPCGDPSVVISKDLYGIVTMCIPGFETVMVSQPIDTHFTLTRLQGFVDKYTKVFFHDLGYYYDQLPPEEKTGQVFLSFVSCDDLYKSEILDKVCEDIKLVLISGLDLLLPKSLITKNKEYQYAIRLWADNGKQCINYGSFYKDIDVSICTSRDNIFIFPVVKKEQ